MPDLIEETKGKIRLSSILRKQLTQGKGRKLSAGKHPAPQGLLECRVPGQVLFSLFEWRLILSIGFVP